MGKLKRIVDEDDKELKRLFNIMNSNLCSDKEKEAALARITEINDGLRKGFNKKTIKPA